MCKVGGGANRCTMSDSAHIKEDHRKRVSYQAHLHSMTSDEWAKSFPEQASRLEAQQKAEFQKKGIPTSQQLMRRKKVSLPTQSVSEEEAVSHYKSHIETMAPEENLDALIQYSGLSYIDINQGLRDGKSMEELNPHDKRRVERMDDAFSKCSYAVPKGAKLYRYVQLEDNQSPSEWVDKHFVDGVMEDRGFMSTTLSPEHAVTMAEQKRLQAGYNRKKKRFVILEVEAEKGIPVSPHYGEGSLQRLEQELILPRGLSFAVSSQSTLTHEFPGRRLESEHTIVDLTGTKASLPMFSISQVSHS